MINKNNHSGQLLIEVVVATGIVVLVLVGITELMTYTIKTNRYNNFREKALATIQSDFRRCEIQSFDDQIAFFSDGMDGDNFLSCVHCTLENENPCLVSVSSESIQQLTEIVKQVSLEITVSDGEFTEKQQKVFTSTIY